jgi:glycosyltransferase involved in cell wall biosynthesis
MPPPAPSLRLIESVKAGAGLHQPIRSVALIGNYPPRRCGIATFTADVREALLEARPDLVCDVYAMTDPGESYAYPEEVRVEIRQEEPADYLAAAVSLNHSRPDVICVEHEFGIFGGSAGEHLLLMLDAVDRPVVSTLHTVLEQPNDDQKRVFERLLARSSRLLVMAERGRRILREVWNVPDHKIAVIPHGAPARPLADPEAFKQALGFAGHEVLFTFGLLSPNKGIETVIKALPQIVKARPTALYVVLGATHPHLIAQQGEQYRESLKDLAASLGVSDHLHLIDSFTDTPKLLDYLQAADVYVTPYLNAAQITSGTLSYAAALGKPVVSTPYWHAEELLGDGRGRLVPFGDSDAIAREVTGLLSDDMARQALRESIYAYTRSTVWSAYAETTLAVLEAARAPRKPLAEAPRAPLRPSPNVAALNRMTDGCGMLQHSLFAIPDRRHGYCVDDNARALILMHRLPGPLSPEKRTLISTYAAFVQHAWNEDEGRFRNFMSFERQWLEPVGSEDSCGRAAMAVAVSAAESQDPLHRRWAVTLMDRVMQRLDEVTSVRANTFVMLGLVSLMTTGWEAGRVRAGAARRLDRLAGLVKSRKAQGLPWFEPALSYDNARLPEAMIRAGKALGDAEAVQLGLEALDWLCLRQTAPGGHFLPVATADFGQPLEAKTLFDQQPVEAAATVEACEAAFAATGDPRWAAEAERAYAWFEGANCLGARMATPDGECYDGLTWNGPNENQGAESVLSYQSAACALLRISAASASAQKMAADR